MIEMSFAMNDGTRQTYTVVGIKSQKYEAMTIQISKVVDTRNGFKLTKDGAYYPFGYIYEEIDNDDFVTYCRFMGEDNIKRNYPWARELFK